MSFNVGVDASHEPILISPYEVFLFKNADTKLTVRSGSGYPGQGGCFYGIDGTCYLSQYRLVFILKEAALNVDKSCSLPLYAVRTWQFRNHYFAKKSWNGTVNPVPGGGLIGVGTFQLQFKTHGFWEFRRHITPFLEQSRTLFDSFSRLSQPSILLVPAGKKDEINTQIAYISSNDPFSIYITTEE